VSARLYFGVTILLQILKRINATISQRIAAGENLPPPPRTAIAGPEYFGLNDLSTIVSTALKQR
jgi:hypothetical protein